MVCSLHLNNSHCAKVFYYQFRLDSRPWRCAGAENHKLSCSVPEKKVTFALNVNFVILIWHLDLSWRSHYKAEEKTVQQKMHHIRWFFYDSCSICVFDELGYSPRVYKYVCRLKQRANLQTKHVSLVLECMWKVHRVHSKNSCGETNVESRW